MGAHCKCHAGACEATAYQTAHGHEVAGNETSVVHEAWACRVRT